MEEAAHVKAECALREHPTLGRWLRQTPSVRLVLDRAEIAAEARLDGKYLLSTSDPDLSAEDVALGYKNLLEAECGFQDLKSTIELRPIFYRLEPGTGLLSGLAAEDGLATEDVVATGRLLLLGRPFAWGLGSPARRACVRWRPTCWARSTRRWA